jgi:dihydroorotase-like cyclic amidohydrolase
LFSPFLGESLIQAYLEWKEDAEDKSLCDVAFAVALDSWNESVKADMEELVKEHGVNSFKIDMEAEGDEEGTSQFDNQQMIEIFECCKNLGAVVQVHAENGIAIKQNERKLKKRDITGPEGYLISRPDEVEEEAVSRALCLAKNVNVPLVICAPTSKSVSERILKKRAEGQVVFVQPSIASLTVDGSHIFNQCWSHAAAFVTSPPLRDDPETPEALVDNITDNEDGTFAVCSDHRTFNAATKGEFGIDDFSAIPRGVNGVEERMSLLWDKIVSSEKGGAEKFVSATSSNAAKIANIYPQKGNFNYIIELVQTLQNIAAFIE